MSVVGTQPVQLQTSALVTWSLYSKDQDKHEDFTIKDKDQTENCNFFLKYSLSTRTNNTGLART